MSLQKIKCPECHAWLRSRAGFKLGKTVCCSKCESDFIAEDPGEEALRSARANEERSYKDSALRFVILGALVLTLLVLAFMLFQKRRNDTAPDVEPAAAPNADPLLGPGARPNAVQPKIDISMLPKDGQKTPPKDTPKRPAPKGGKGPDAGTVAGGVIDGVFSGGPVPAAQAAQLTTKYTAALVGTWATDLGDGVTEELTYGANGTYSASRAGPGATTASGKYLVKGLVGTKGLKLQLDGAGEPRTITVTFEDDELQHPSLEKGVTASFRKK